MHSLVTSIFLYACESLTLTSELQRRIQAMEMRCYHKILHISNREHVTNKEVHAKIQQAIRPHEDHLTTIKRRILKWYRHVSHSSVLAKIILQGTVKRIRWQGRWKKRWGNGIREWTGLDVGVCQVPYDSGKQRKMEEMGLEVICGAPTTLMVRGYVKVKTFSVLIDSSILWENHNQN